MSWFVEHLHRDGSVLARVAVPQRAGIRIGRALDNDLVVDDPHCAAHHARLEVADDGSAQLVDLGTVNGIVAGRSTRAPVHPITSDLPYRIGQSLIRVRSSHWPVAVEQSLSQRAMWPFALLGMALVLGHGAWEIWLRDVETKSPPYLYGLSGLAAGLCLWSAAYGLFGRLVTGVQRFFSHLIIASVGYLAGTVAVEALQGLAFAMSWLWPVRIIGPVVVVVAALTVRKHLRLADPRHWPALRIGLATVAALAIVIPVAQEWMSNRRLTDVQTLTSVEHPALRWAQPVSLETFSAETELLKARVDKARKTPESDTDDADDNE